MRAKVPDAISTASFSVNHGIHGELKRAGAPRKRMARRHSVDFQPKEEVFHVDKHERELVPEIWYNKEEYELIRARNSLIVRMMKNGTFEESEAHTFRGLEHKLKAGAKERSTHKFNGLNAVLEEQDRQYARGIHDQTLIAEKYGCVTSVAHESAFITGLRDAEASYSWRCEELSSGDFSDVTIDVDESGNIIEDDTVEEVETAFSDSQSKNKTRLRSLFVGLSNRRKEGGKMTRRTSL